MAEERATIPAHFVAHLKIERVTKQGAPFKAPERHIEEVTQITLKGETLEKLVEKLGKHIDIIEES